MKKGRIDKVNWEKKYNYRKSIVFDSNDLNCEGARFQIVKFDPNSVVKPHHHKTLTEIWFVQAGEGIIKLNRKEHKVKPGDFFLCEPGDVHEFIIGEKGLVIIDIKFNEPEEGDMVWDE